MNKKENRVAFLFLIPSLAGFILFFILPMVISLRYATTDNVLNGHFVGLTNFKNLFASEAFRLAAFNTLRFMAIGIPLNIIVSLFIACLLHKRVGNGWLKAIFMSPLVIPSACVAFLFQSFFAQNGLLSQVVGNNTDWLQTEHAFTIAVIVYVWKNMGFNLVLFLAGLGNIPKDYYEWAMVDGMRPIQMFFKITLVYLVPTLFIVFVMSFINSFKVFREIYMLSGDYPNGSIYMLQHYMNNQFSSLNYQNLTAASFVITAVVTVFVVIFFNIDRKTDWRE